MQSFRNRLLVGAALAGAAAQAWGGTGGSSDALAGAVARAPAVQAAKLRVVAARAKAGSAGKFPDPQVEGMGSRVDNGLETWPKYEARLQQPLPKAGEREADRERALAAVAMAEADYQMMAGDMAAEVASMLAEADAARARAGLLGKEVDRVNQVLGSVEARIATGQGSLPDRLTLQSSAAAMQLMVGKEQRMAEDAENAARGMLGLPKDHPLPACASPATAAIAPESTGAARLAAAKAAEAEAMGKMARATARPMTAVGIQVSREAMAMGNEDMVGLAFMMEIPWHTGRYARADEAAAAAEHAAAAADATAAKFSATAALARLERAARLAESTRQFARETGARLNAEYESFLRSAAASGGMAGQSTVLMLVDILEKEANTQLQVIEAETAERSAAARLWKFAGPTAFPPP